MKLAIAILLLVFTGSFQSVPESKVKTQIINQEQLPAAANVFLKQHTGVYPSKITRNETSAKEINYTVEATSKDSKELYVYKFDAKGYVLNTSVTKQGKTSYHQ